MGVLSQLIEHGGKVPGHLSQVARLPNDGLGVVILSNLDTVLPAVLAIKYRIIDSYLGLPHVDWRSR